MNFLGFFVKKTIPNKLVVYRFQKTIYSKNQDVKLDEFPSHGLI